MTPSHHPDASTASHDLREAVARAFHAVIAGFYTNQGWPLAPFEETQGAWWRHATELCAGPIAAEVARLTGLVDELQGLLVTAEICADKLRAERDTAEAELATLKAAAARDAG